MLFNHTYFDLVAAALCFTSTILASRRIRSSWLFSIVACILYSVLFFEKSFYFNLATHFTYLPISIYGALKWYQKPMAKQPVRFTRISTLLAVATVLCAGTLACYLQGVDEPLDFISSYLSIIAMALMSQHYIECWILWILADLAYIKLYISSNMYFSMLKSCCYLMVASYSLYYWHKQSNYRGTNK